MLTGGITKPYDVYPQAALVLMLLLYKYNKIYWGDTKYIFPFVQLEQINLGFYIIQKIYYFATFKVTVPSELGTVLKSMKAAVLK